MKHNPTLPDRAFKAVRVLALGVVTMLTLGACTVGPDYVRPDPPQGVRYTSTQTEVQTVSAPTAMGESQKLVQGLQVDAQWWRQFGSNDLNRLIDQALKANPSLISLQASLRQASELVTAYSGSTQLPQVDATLGAQSQQQSPSSLGTTGNGRQFELYNASVGVRYKLDLAGGIERQVQALMARADYRAYELDAARLALAGNIATAAMTRARLAMQWDATSKILRAQQEQLRLAHQRVRLGHASPDEVLSLQAQADQTRSTLPTLRKQLEQTEHLLAVLAGLAPANASIPAFVLTDFTLPTDLPVVVPSELVRGRPDIRASEALMIAANAEYGVALAKLYPQLNLSASLGSQALTAGALFGPGSAVWTLLGQLTQPLLNFGLPAESRAALAAFEASAANYQGVVLDALREVADSLRAVEHDARSLQALASADAAAQASWRSERRRYELGAASSLELLVVEQQAQQIRISLIAAQAQRLTDSVALYLAMGIGGITHTLGP